MWNIDIGENGKCLTKLVEGCEIKVKYKYVKVQDVFVTL